MPMESIVIIEKAHDAHFVTIGHRRRQLTTS